MSKRRAAMNRGKERARVRRLREEQSGVILPKSKPPWATINQEYIEKRKAEYKEKFGARATFLDLTHYHIPDLDTAFRHHYKFFPDRHAFELVRSKTMQIPVIYEDETENEFDIELCCDTCASNSYGWTAAQFQKVLESAEKGTPIKVPNRVMSEANLKDFVKSLSL